MSILNDLLNVRTMGESARLDYVIREHEKLKVQFDALTELLVSSNLITREELDRKTSALASPAPAGPA